MRWMRIILLMVALVCPEIAGRAGNDVPQDLAGNDVIPDLIGDPDEAKVDIAEIIFGHIGDSYGWHITEWNGRHIVIPLPCIVHSSTGWHVFMSSKIEHGHEYEGLFIAEEGRYEDKIVERGADGALVRPFDISITKNVASLMFGSVLLIILVLSCAGWYRRNDGMEKAPGGFAGLMEMLVMMVYDDLIKDSVGPEHKKYAPYLLTAFFFIFLNNLLGIVPFFPGGANLTGNIAVTGVLAVFTFLAVNLFANRHYWKEIFWPDGPVFLKCPIPILQIIEILGMFTKPFSLMVRLFANIMAGHAMILGLVSVIFVAAKIDPVISGSMTVITLVFGIFMDCLELLVAFIQAYVFTMLSAVFIGLSRQEEQHEDCRSGRQ